MKFPVIHTCLLMSLFLASCASRSADAQDSKPEFRVTPKNADDTIAVLDENFLTVMDIHSDKGIGSATFELIEGSMPDVIVIRLHLKGLEGFQLASTQDTVSASVSSGEVFNVTNERVLFLNAEIPIGSIHPLWLDIQIVSESKHVPLEDGYFEITIPPEFIRKAGNSFEIQWIDFYR
jgi:hypothetical protein